MTRRAPALALLLACAVGAFGCSPRNGPIVLVPAAGAVTSTSTTAPTASSSGTAPTPTARVAASIRGPGPQRVERDALEVLALSLRVANTGADAVDLSGLTLRATGALDDAVATTTARLAVDRDGDGRFDRAIDRVLASAGFATDDGPLPFTFLPVAAAPGATVDLLVLLDLSGRGAAHQDLRLSIERVDAVDPRGAAALVDIAAEIGPWLRLGGWVEPHEALSVAGEALRPRAVRDAQGNTHVGLFQNLNMTSNVWYSVHDGRSYSAPDNISRASRTAWNQDLALDAGLPHLVWEEWDQGTNDFAIRHSQFDPAAFRWTTAATLSDHGGMQLNPRVLVSPGGVVDVVWEDWGSSGVTPRVAHRRRAGGVWASVAEVTSASASTSLQTRDPALAPLPGGAVLVAWVENEPGRSEVRARVLSASGAWGPVEVVATGAGVLARAELLDEAGATHLLYVDAGEVQHARRTSQGWSRPVNVSRSASDPSSEPAMALWQGTLHVAWIEAVGAGSHVATARVNASGGGGFSAPELLTLGQGDVSRKCPAVVPEGDRLRLLWQDRRLGRQRIYTTWRDAGSLEAGRPVVTGVGDPGRPDLSEGPRGELHVVYSVDAGGNGEVFHAVEERPGEGFAAPVNVSRSAGGSYQPTVAAVGSAVHAAWEEETAGAFAIVTTTRAGSSWSAVATVSSGARAYAPRLSAGGGRAALVWTQETSPNDFDVQVSLHDGQRFPLGRPVAPVVGSSAWNPDVAVSASGVSAVAWEEEGARREIVVAVIGSATTSVAGVASSFSGQYAPRLAWAREDLVVAWVEDGRARVATRRAGQSAFDAAIDLSAGGSWAPDVVADGDAVAVVWEQWTGNDARVVLDTLPPTSAPVPLDEGPGPARRVAAAVGPFGGVHVAWSAQGSVFVRARRAR